MRNDVTQTTKLMNAAPVESLVAQSPKEMQKSVVENCDGLVQFTNCVFPFITNVYN